MSKFSDHKKPQIDITDYLAEVYRSDVNMSVMDTAFNRHLTKDDTTRIAGFIGEGNPAALIDRQIKETTPHRQAYQLAPTMYTKVGSKESSLSFTAFQNQLTLMGVSMDRFPKWADTTQFNWIPPVNIDMLVNYADYFWAPGDLSEPAQYITFENQCKKVTSKINAYNNILRQRGATFPLVSVDFVSNTFNISNKNDDLFVENFTFYTKNATNQNLNNKFWKVVSSTFDSDSNITSIRVLQPIAICSTIPPTSPSVGEWWFDTTYNQIKSWSGSAWTLIPAVFVADLSLTELASVYQAEANCACKHDTGWDTAPWDDNQLGNVVWNQQLMSCITHPTETDWMAANNATPCHPSPAPQALDIWYDITHDRMMQRNASNNDWVVVTSNFSTVLVQTTGDHQWDYANGCVVQVDNQWSAQNKWIHKSEIQSFAGVKRAAIPILEYNSNIEMNEWVADTVGWKYRSEIGNPFIASDITPSHFELEPIMGYNVTHVGNNWFIYLYDKTISMSRDVDYTSTFVPGYEFRIVDDGVLSDVYTVKNSTYRESLSTDPINVRGDYMITVLELEEPTFLSPIAGGINGSMIIPQHTSVGDPWRGYHAHWVMDRSVYATYPIAPQTPNLYYTKNNSIDPVIRDVTPQGLRSIWSNKQIVTIEHDGIDQIPLHNSLVFDVGSTNHYATKGGASLCVYVNDIRQYGTYDEVITSISTPYCMVGYNTWTTQTLDVVSGIQFSYPLQLHDVVRIDVGPSSLHDMGRVAVPVRTIENEDDFIGAVAAGTQPAYEPLIRYRRVEQLKTSTNQYPLFNVYDVITGQVVKASNLFGYAEDATQPMHAAIQRRIIADSTGREFTFEQSMQDKSNGKLYGYRNATKVTNAVDFIPTTWWYNPVSQSAHGWDGYTWSTTVFVSLSGGALARRYIHVSDVEPTQLLDLDGALWYNPTTNVLYSRNIISALWSVVGPVIVGADPTLTTVWRHGTSPVVPQFVDKNRDPIATGSSAGSWQIPDQWMFNPEHQNRSRIDLTELITHLTSIVNNQVTLPGFLGGGRFTLTNDEYNYGVGGTIKEHNDSFDTLISAVNVNNATPVGIIEFAQNEYAFNLQFVRDLYYKEAVSLLTSGQVNSVVNIKQFMIDSIISKYEQNEFVAQIYSDTSAYDAATDTGVKSWVSTAPMFGLGFKYRPYLTHHANGMVELMHHDGHRSQITLTGAEEDRLSRLITNIPDNRTDLGKIGIVSPSNPPATLTEFASQYNSNVVNMHYALLPGVYWYQLTPTGRTLYRLQCHTIAPSAPSMVSAYGLLPDGAMYYNTTTDAVYKKHGTAWEIITTPDAQDISPLWVSVDFSDTLAELLLEIETRLYEVTPSYSTTLFDFDSLIGDADDADEYQRLYENRFGVYVKNHNIQAPMVNNTYSATNPFTWNYKYSIVADAPRQGVNPQQLACWQALYTLWYNTPYPHLEPWCLQGYTSKPVWWDLEYADDSGNRKWKYNHATLTGMWQNIKIGNVPAGRPYPNGKISTGNSTNDNVMLPTYAYFSVNISDSTIPGGYAPDAVLPPYYDVSSIQLTLPTVRSLYISLSAQVTTPFADYVFGDIGPVEWQWTTSMQYVYDKSVIAFLMQPVRFMHAAFGPKFINVDQLQVETTFNRVYSHNSALFHGDLYDTNQPYLVRGLNQWYVNYNRFSGFDTNTQFRQEWAGWTPKLTYQFAGIVDTSAFDISTKYFDINEQDYNISLINNGVLNDAWIDAFEVGVLSMPPAIIQHNNQGLWKFELSSLAAIPRIINYYGVKSYTAQAIPGTNTIHALRYNINSIVASTRKIMISGDQTKITTYGRRIAISNSLLNNGEYTITSSTYDTTTDVTTMVVSEPLVPDSSGGYIDVIDLSIQWNTGDVVVLSATKLLPAPFVINTPYYIIRVNDNVFQLAETYNDAFAGLAVTVNSGGTGDFIISQLSTSFQTMGGTGHSTETWFHYELDKSVVYQTTPPTIVHGMQNLINIIDGYVEFQKTNHVKYGVPDGTAFDPDTGRLIDWQLEIERCIEWAYGLRRARLVVADRYPVSVDTVNNTLTFVDSTPTWAAGTKVVLSTTGTLPAPIIGGTPYFVVPTDVSGTFKLSISANTLDASMLVDFTTGGSGIIQVGTHQQNVVYPTFEINPFRDSIWIETPVGVISNVISGPYSDIRVQQTIFDQYSRPLTADSITVYREDGRSKIAIRPQLKNDVDPFLNDPYNYLHFGGAHIFVEGYEHFLMFNDSTVGGDLIFDPFLGLHVKKFNLDYNETSNYTLRPTLGGFYLTDGEFKRNIEGSVGDLAAIYDATGMNESTAMAQHAHSLIGYHGNVDYLDLLNVNSKAQFAFYRGMLQAKGSVNSIKAYINSRRFIDAKMDEFWAWKVADFGDIRPKVYPEIKLMSTDSVQDDVRLLFLSPYETADRSIFVDDINKGFQEVSFSTSDRWVDFPEQRDVLASPLFLDAEISDLSVVYIGALTPTQIDITNNGLTHWYNGTSMFVWNGTDWVSDNGRVFTTSTHTYWKHNGIADAVRVIRKKFNQEQRQYPIISANSGTNTLTISGDHVADFIVGNQFQIINSLENDGVHTIINCVLVGTDTVITVDSSLVQSNIGAIVVTDRTIGNFSTLYMTEGPGVDSFVRVNAEVVKFNNTGFTDIMMIFTLNPSANRISPAKLVDCKSHTVVHDMPLWHPALNHHYPNAMHNIDIFAGVDPAVYGSTWAYDNSNQPWNNTEDGVVWFDTSSVSYLPYYDDCILPNINDRLYNWGKLQSWCDMHVYKWTTSTIPPTLWDDQVLRESTDISIPQNEKKTGTPRKTTFKRSRQGHTATILPAHAIESTLPVQTGDDVLFTVSVGGSLPTPIETGIKYTVRNVTNVGNVYNITIEDRDTHEQILVTNDGVGTLTIVRAFTADQWVKQGIIHERLFGSMDLHISNIPAFEPVLLLSSPDWVVDDAAQVYVNGLLIAADVPLTGMGLQFGVSLINSGVSIRDCDIVDVVRLPHVLTADETNFNPDVEDDGSLMVQWIEDYEYTITAKTLGSINTGISKVSYYSYWVESSTSTDGNHTMSIHDVAVGLKNIPTPHFVVQRPLDDTTLMERYGYGITQYGKNYSIGDMLDLYHIVPVMYRNAIIRKAASYITDDDRFIVKFTRDASLRDDIQPTKYTSQLKNKHEEWVMFRRAQSSSIPQQLWIKLTESMMGCAYNDHTVRVPALERELYDAANGTSTRYGLGSNQTFVDKNLAIQTILHYLQSPNNDFYPADIDDFFVRNKFTTAAAIKAAMDEIYNTFPAEHVNNMWFDALHDAMSTRTKYKELMKTSWIALHGIRVLEVGGLFDE